MNSYFSRGALSVLVVMLVVSCVAPQKNGPFRLGVIELSPELDSVKPLAAADFSGWVYAEGVLVGSVDEKWVMGQSLDTGKVLWWLAAPTPLAAPVTAIGQSVIVGFRDGKVSKVNILTGKVDWSTTLDSFISRKLVISGSTLLAFTAGQQLYGLDFRTGEKRWIYDGGFPDGLVLQGGAPPTIYQQQVIVGYASGEIHSVDLGTGALQWKHDAEQYVDQRFHDVVGEVVIIGSGFLVSRYDGSVARIEIDGNDPRKLWSDTVNNVTTSSYREGRFFVGCLNGDVISFDIQTGRKIWTAKTGQSVTTLTPGDSTIYVSGGDGRINAINSENGEVIWYDDIGAEIVRNPFLYKDGIYFATGFKNIYGYKVF